MNAAMSALALAGCLVLVVSAVLIAGTFVLAAAWLLGVGS